MAVLRTMAMVALREQGWTLADIGEAFGVTRERIRQILEMSDGPTAEDVRAWRDMQAEQNAAQRRRTLIAWLKDHPGGTTQEARRTLDWDEQELASAMTDEVRRLAVRTREGDYAQQYTDDDVLNAIRAAWNVVEGTASGLSHKKYQELVSTGVVNGPSAPRILQRYGTWIEAAELAGIPSGKRPNREYESTWTDDEILRMVATYLADPATTGSYGGWDAWKRVNATEGPSGPTLRNRIGSWSEIKRQALGIGN